MSDPDNDQARDLGLKVGLSAEGLDLATNSLFACAVDALGGEWIRSKSNRLRRANMKADEFAKAEIAIIRALTEHAISRIKSDPEAAERLLQLYQRDILQPRRQSDEILRLTLDGLVHRPPTPSQIEAAPSTLSEEFLGRFKHYASTATTEELQVRFASVLAQEIREPGTFSAKVLRIVDETDRQVAANFRDLCMRYRFGGGLIRFLMSKSDSDHENDLVFADLIARPGTWGDALFFSPTYLDGGDACILEGDHYALVLKGPFEVTADSSKGLRGNPGRYLLECFTLTPAGKAISSIFKSGELEIAQAVLPAVRGQLKSGSIEIYERSGDGWVTLKKPSAPGG